MKRILAAITIALSLATGAAHAYDIPDGPALDVMDSDWGKVYLVVGFQDCQYGPYPLKWVNEKSASTAWWWLQSVDRGEPEYVAQAERWNKDVNAKGWEQACRFLAIMYPRYVKAA